MSWHLAVSSNKIMCCWNFISSRSFINARGCILPLHEKFNSTLSTRHQFLFKDIYFHQITERTCRHFNYNWRKIIKIRPRHKWKKVERGIFEPA